MILVLTLAKKSSLDHSKGFTLEDIPVKKNSKIDSMNFMLG
jgi:uncharacterized membrane protein YobD (UPF0266 family)